MLGFIIVRHVTSKLTDYYWKECYTCIRKLYDNPIMIVDDSSDRTHLTENIVLTNCTVIYDTDKKAAELLPYYYFHLLKPFDTAVILHDSVFLQNRIDFGLDCDVKFLWTFVKNFDHDIFHLMNELMCDLPRCGELIDLYHQKDKWTGCFGVMSVIKWDLLHRLDQKYTIFSIIPKLKTRDHRSALERVFALLVHKEVETHGKVDTFFGDIHSYIRWGTTFTDYLQGLPNPVVKVWTGR
jgi:hypothetical protein